MTSTSDFKWTGYLTVPMRLALGLSFLFAVADRLGILGPPGTPGVSWGSFSNFLKYNAQVNSFAPPAIRDALGITATAFETIFGTALVIGVRTRLAAAGSAALLVAFGTAMAVSLGIKSPFDYSVFSAMAGTLMLAASPHYPLTADALWRRVFRRHRPGSARAPNLDLNAAGNKV